MPGNIRINHQNFLANLDELQRFNPLSKIIPVLKANAYGHGALPLAMSLASKKLDYLALATADEALALKTGGYPHPLLVLGVNTPNQVLKALEAGVVASLCSFADLHALKEWAPKFPVKVHLKFDTGLNRAGVSFREAEAFLKAVKEIQTGRLAVEVEAIYTHLIASTQNNHPATLMQFERFESLIQKARSILGNQIKTHIANSGAHMLYSDLKHDWVRVGIALYGISPDPDLDKKLSLKPVLSWQAPIINLHSVLAGESVSYNQIFYAHQPTTIATLGIGYGDGYRRCASNRSFVVYKGHRCPVVGAVCMDMTMVDIGDLKAEIGEEVCLLGTDEKETISANELAGFFGTIGYEVTCGLSARNTWQHIK